MKRIMKISMLGVLLLAMTASVPALAHGGYYHRPRVSVGFVFGAPGYWYYPPPYYYYPYYPGVAAVPAEPTVYIEQGDSYTSQEQTLNYWYYCPASKTYYPYVKQCAERWQRVTPTPPPGG